MIINLYAQTTATWAHLQQRLETRRRDEVGAGALEYVVIALGLLLIATAVIVVIKAAVTSRTDQIK